MTAQIDRARYGNLSVVSKSGDFVERMEIGSQQNVINSRIALFGDFMDLGQHSGGKFSPDEHRVIFGRARCQREKVIIFFVYRSIFQYKEYEHTCCIMMV